jgi:hypothetical protein
MPSFKPLSTLSARRILTGTGPVREDRQPERGVSRGEDRCDERNRRPPCGREQQRSDQGPERDREWQADQQEPHGELSIALDLTEPDG